MTADRSLLRLAIPWAWAGSGSTLTARAVATVLWTANLVLVAITVVGFFVSDAGYDWAIFVEAGSRITEGGLFAWEGQYTWNYSPLLAYLFALVAPIGFVGWTRLHVASVALIRDRWLAAVTLLSWPFWADVYNGNTIVFVFVAAVGALQRNSIATGSYLVLCLLMPRPLQLPLMDPLDPAGMAGSVRHHSSRERQSCRCHGIRTGVA